MRSALSFAMRVLPPFAAVCFSCGDDGATPSPPATASVEDGGLERDGGVVEGGGGPLGDGAPVDDGRAPACADRLAPTTVPLSDELLVAEDPAAPMGIFDPSVVYPKGALAGAMAYSAVKAKDDIATRIAVSDDEGLTWRFAAQANVAQAVPADAGNLISEVSSLVVDPLEPSADRRWKLFSHRYLAKGAALHYDIGHIALPGGALALSVGCVSVPPEGPRIRVELLLSVDHAGSWSHVGVLVPTRDAACLGRSAGLSRVNAVDLFGAAGKAWLSVTPENPATGYRGCAFVEITDLAKAEIARHSDGAPLVTKLLATPTDQFSGACAYAEGATRATALMSVAFLADARTFRIFRTGAVIP